MFNFAQAARGNVGKVNQADRFTPTHTPHTRPGGPRAPGEEKKNDKNGETRGLGPAADQRVVDRKLQGRAEHRGGGKKEKTF